MDPSILSFSNTAFYGNRVRSSENLCNRKPRVKVPFCFISTSTVGVSQGNQEILHKTSYRNPYEAFVVRCLLHLDGDIRNIQKAKSSMKPRIIVISPYKAQVELIKEELQNEWKYNIDVATVDSFQGQEGDVVIVSTVRTNKAGFVDDSQRINVSLTRAKRVLRVVGNISFFCTLEHGSTLRKLAEYADREGCCDSQQLRALKLKTRKFAWKTPDWSRGMIWRPTMTQRYHHCIKGMGTMDRNVALNTLLEVCTPNIKNLSALPNTKAKTWQTSALKGFENRVRIVWVPKEGFEEGSPRPVVEAHFAGTKGQCNTFRQKHPVVPKGTAYVQHGLQGIRTDGIDTAAQSEQIDVSWLVSDEISNAVIWDEIDGLPEGCFLLDPYQERVVQEAPPLLLESRSGTGKTNVLFQHAVKHARDSLLGGQLDRPRPICFVTVSPRLRRELYKRYDEIQVIEEAKLPTIKFFSFRELLGRLLEACKSEMKVEKICCFADYLNARRSHQSLAAEPSLVENEIGGVIMGSLESAMNKGPLTREKYLAEKRSNVPTDSSEGRTTRHHVYNVYSDYNRWKKENSKYDINDILLYLIGKNLQQMFLSAYLDEIQDFSYAAIFLICQIAGKATLHWVCAGDTAQMISPGCSFTFDGLKQTMLAVSPGIEQHLKKVTHLARNYRTTKAVLDVGNAILDVAKKYFPDAIEYARPETAVKDLRIKVVMVNWQDACNSRAMFGPQQALIFTSLNPSRRVVDDLNSWLENHPFVLSSLESKGLEFDDVMVAFDVDRKLWNVSSMQIGSLRLLRELYVAVTRAKRRVVILVRKKEVADFFTGLECNIQFEEPDTVLVEFNNETSAADWFKRGMDLFEDHQFRIAAGCFKAGQSFGWANWSQGLHEKGLGQDNEAVASFRSGARYFYEDADYTHALDLVRLIVEIPPWDHQDDFILDGSQLHCPNYFTREESVKIDLARGAWGRISVDDLADASIAFIFAAFRGQDGVKEIIRSCSQEDREKVSRTQPNFVGDYYVEERNYDEATRLFISGKDYERAKEATSAAIKDAKSEALERIASYWGESNNAQREINNSDDAAMLVLLFQSPQKAASIHAEECMQRFGAKIVRYAVKKAGLDATELHRFDRSRFHKDVIDALTIKYQSNRIGIVKWFVEHKDNQHALDLVEVNLKKWSNEELLHIVGDELKFRPKTTTREILRRNLPVSDLDCFLNTSSSQDVDIAIDVSDQALGSVEKSKNNMNDVLALWNPKRTRMPVRTALDLRSTSRTAMFLNLFQKPADMSREFPQQCMNYFGTFVIKKAVLAGGPYGSTSEVKAIFHRFSRRAFESIPKREIEAVTRQQAQRSSTTEDSRAARPQPNEARPTSRSVPERPSRDNTFNLDDRVELHGLRMARMNGRHGKIAGDILLKDGRYRYPVLLDGETKPKSIQAQNLRMEVASSSSESSDDEDSVPSLQPREDSTSSEDSDSNSSSDGDGVPPLRRRARSESESDSLSLPPLDQDNRSSDDDGDEEDRKIDNGSMSSDSSAGDSSMPDLLDPKDSSSSESESESD